MEMTNIDLSEAVQPQKIRQYTTRIQSAWNKTLEDIFLVGDLLREARKELNDGETDDYIILLNQLSFGARVAERLETIASDKRFRKPSISKLLPACWTTLDVLQRMSPSKFSRALKKGAIKPEMTRKDAEALAVPRSRSLKGASNSIHSIEDSYLQITFSLKGSKLKNQKALTDVHFICDFLKHLFSENRSGVSLTVKGKKPSKKLQSSYEVYKVLIGEIAKLENMKRDREGLSKLSSVKQLLSLLGANPDRSDTYGFSLLESVAIAYARRNGIDCIEDSDFKWFAASAEVEPELLGSFLPDVQKQASEILESSRKASQNGKARKASHQGI